MARKIQGAPTPEAPKSAREILQEFVNTNTLQTATKGFKALDTLAEILKDNVRRQGFAGAEAAIDQLNMKVKRSVAQAMTGRKQE